MKLNLICLLLTTIAIKFCYSSLCPFEDCDCNYDGTVERTTDIYCENIYEFPKRTHNTQQTIGVLSLTKLGLTSLPDDRLYDLKIHFIDLNYNRIEELQENVLNKLESLEVLEFNNNLLRNIHQNALKHVKNSLKEVKLSNNELSQMTKNDLSSVFEDLIKLDTLKLANNSLNEMPDFSGIRNLEDLDFSFNLLTDINENDLPPSLTTLHLKQNRLSTFESKWFSNLPHLKLLDMSNNIIKTADEGSSNSLQNLISLKLEFNDFKHVPSKLLANLPNLEELNLSYQKLNLSEISEFAFDKKSLSSDGQIKYRQISLSGNRILNFDRKAFCSSIHKKNVIIDELYLGGNLFTSIDPCVFKPLTYGRLSKSKIDFGDINNLKCSCSLAYLAENFEVKGSCIEKNIKIDIDKYKCENEKEIQSMCLDEEYDCRPQIDESVTTPIIFTTIDKNELNENEGLKDNLINPVKITTEKTKNDILNVITTAKPKSSSDSKLKIEYILLTLSFLLTIQRTL